MARDAYEIQLDLKDALVKKLHIKASQADSIVELIDELIGERLSEGKRDMWDDDR